MCIRDRPWVLAKDDANAERLDTVLYTMCEALRAVAVLYNAVMPKAMASLWSQLGAGEALGALAVQRIADAGRWGQLPPGSNITKGDALFPRLLAEPTEAEAWLASSAGRMPRMLSHDR